MDNINLSGFPLIFPKLTAYLINKGVSIQVTGKMGSDYRLNEVIIRALLSSEWESFPDVSYYDKKQQRWNEYTFESTEAEICLGRQGVIHYSKQMYRLQDERGLLALCDFLRLYSNGEFTTTLNSGDYANHSLPTP